MRLQVSVLVIIFGLFSISTFAQSRNAGRPAQVLVEPIVFEYEESKIEAVGTAEATQSVVLFPAAADIVTSINFIPGQQVKKGDVLVELDNRRQRVAVARAEITLRDAQRTVQRFLKSQREGAIAESNLDDARTARDLAQVALDEAKADLEDRQILAPFDGLLGLTDIEVGDRVNLQTPITTIDARQNLYVNFRAPEAALMVLMSRPEVSLQPWSNRTISIDAQIAEVDSRINEQDRTLRARALFKNRQDIYRPGMSFRVTLTMRGERFASIPEAAVSWGASGAYVWKAMDGKAVKVPVEIVQRLRGRILVAGDLEEGESLIAEGIQRLREGQNVAPQARLASNTQSQDNKG